MNSDPELIDQEEENEISNEEPPIEISISVPNLSEFSDIIPPVMRSNSENEDKQNTTNRSLLMKMERRAKNREKLMSMKRYSGFLKRPEILETVYSVEEDGTEAGKVSEGETSKTAEKEEVTEMKTTEAKEEETDGRESETTEYDYSTDDESLRMIFSETDQSGCCSEICSRRSSSGSHPMIHRVGVGKSEEDAKARSMEDLRGKMRLIDRRKKFILHNHSVSLDCGDK